MQLSPVFVALVASANCLTLPFRWNSDFVQIPMLSLSWLSVAEEKDGYMNNPQFELWVDIQANRSFAYILENIGGASNSLDPKEVAYGVVIASPLKKSPNYFYNWIRDSALTIRSLIYHLDDNMAEDFSDAFLRNVVERYIEVNYHLQRLPNKSGKFNDKTRSGLGEPKFMPDGTTFDDNWGRPQSDGPGLRVLTITNYLNFLNKHGLSISNAFLGNASFVYHEIVKPDLEYVMYNWNSDAFDLWEEINASHFFNALTQLRALGDGHKLASRLGESPDFLQQLQKQYEDLKAYINDPATGFTRPTLPYVVETPALVRDRKRGGLDAATLLAALHAHNLEYGNTDDIPFDVDDSRILNTISAMVADMKYRYPINHDKIRLRQNIGVGLGRYPEDVYDGYGTSEGNPWFISTASAAEVVFKWIFKKVTREQDIVITPFNKDFFGAFIDDLTDEELGPGEYVIPFGSHRYKQVLISMFNYSDSFMDVIQSHVDSLNGQMLEQFNKYHGYMQGADNLTWSYSSFYNCVRWRFKASFLIDSMRLLAKL
ncbi:CIC11C00000002971 [Sungouiella intermedia]|uniref:glucan 1,4-alpha-glucosidase n=1 Tax=Sungouiella intermedia TaxID=45354 RepID=A0A1L0FWJ5_9ASCO|nr:CIC11C00000002971 [[Candida] intermedia]